MKYTFLLFVFSILTTKFVYSQNFVNGSFETTTSSGCDYNLNKVSFNTKMSNTNAFGAYEQLDIVESGCFIPSIPDGIHAVSIANNPSNPNEGEAIALELTTPLTVGASYQIALDAIAITDFGPQGNLLIGASTSNASFGTTIYTVVTTTSWTNFSFNFIAPNNSTHITVMPVSGISSWNSIDNFSLTSVLPVELLKFDANYQKNSSKVNLEWQTASELQNEKFEIEESQDGREFQKIGEVEGRGTTHELQDYTFEVKKPRYGISYYRLKQIDFDGQFEYSKVLSVNFKGENEEVGEFYPNPSKSGMVYLDYVSKTDEEIIVSVFDITGKLVINQIQQISSGDNNLRFDFSDLNMGIYMVKIGDERNPTHRKLIIER